MATGSVSSNRVQPTGYPVRILDGAGGAGASVRVLIESTDGVNI